MTVATNTLQTVADVGLREDLTDSIWLISPFETPFCNAIARDKATGVTHEWQRSDLASPATNAAIEGDAFPASSFTAPNIPTRLNNRTQIFTKTLSVSRTDEKVLKAGRKSSVAWQLMTKGRELKLDVELALLSNVARVAGTSSTARKLAGALSWIKTNVSMGSGTNPTGDGSDIRVVGTARVLDESMLKTVLAGIFDNSNDNPDIVLMNPKQKQIASTFGGNSTRFVEAENRKLYAGITIYEGDFGPVKFVPERTNLMPVVTSTDNVIVLNSDLWALAWLDPIQKVPLAKIADSTSYALVGEASLESRNEAGSGLIADLTQ